MLSDQWGFGVNTVQLQGCCVQCMIKMLTMRQAHQLFSDIILVVRMMFFAVHVHVPQVLQYKPI